MKDLRQFYDGEFERVGFVLPDGEIVEVENIAKEIEGGFDVSGEDIVLYMDTAIATWHTHPNASSNLSIGDFETFLGFPNLRHFIVGKDDISEYYIEDNEVLVVEA